MDEYLKHPGAVAHIFGEDVDIPKHIPFYLIPWCNLPTYTAIAGVVWLVLLTVMAFK